MAKTIVGLFDDFDMARRACDELIEIGVPERDISLVRQDKETGAKDRGRKEDDKKGSRAGAGAAAGAGTGAVVGGAAGLIAALAGIAIPGFGPVLAAGWLATTLAGAGVGAVAGGLLGALAGAGVPEHEARVYEEGVRRGKTLVTVRSNDNDAQRVAEVLDRHGALDVDQTAAEFERSGWKRSQTETGRQPQMEAGRQPQMQRATGDEVRMPVVEEELQIGKRRVERGRVRVYTHTSETPVEEQVTLREERVRVERRPVGEELRDPALLEAQDEVIELDETSEEAVVAKRARVVEEVVVRKEAEERQETVRDVVRRKEVEVEHVEPGMAGNRQAPFDGYDKAFHEHYNQTLAKRGLSFEQCAPAYRLGSELAADPQMRRRDWREVEPEARQRWETQSPGTWNQVREATQHAWDRTIGHA